ncbi:MAG TPA: Ig-like domain-containing protein [Kofleriaceae bacterium]|nr:Ig-like domain-containing protein [Kofleriaceae bacterium]
MKQCAIAVGLVLSACTFEAGQAPDKLVLKSSNTSLERNGHASVTAAYKFEALELPADDVTWTSSDETVATLSGAGHEIALDALKPGVTRITAHATDLSSTIDITVLVPVVREVSISPSSPSVAAGQNVQLSATATYSDATTADVTTKAIWISSDTSKATVDRGTVHALATGGVTIRAVMDSSQSSLVVTVTAP